MAATTQIQVIISAQDNASKVINGVSNSLNGVADSSANVKKGADIVSGAFLGIGAAVVGASAISAKMASDFQSQMLLIQTQAGGSASEVKKMTQAVLDLAPAVGQTPMQLAQGLYYIESAGFSGAKALDVLKLSAEGAAVGHEQLSDVAKALTSVLNSQIKGVSGATQAMGVMDAIVGHGKMTMSDLTAAISTGILPAAKTAGVSIQQLGAALDVMTNNGIPAQDAATRLRMTLSLMEAPSDQAKKSLESVGLQADSLARDMQSGGIIQAVTDLNAHMNATQQGSATIVKGTKETAAQLSTLGNNILNTNARLKILQEEHVKAGVATDKHNLAIQEAQQKLAGYTAKLGGANQVINTLGGSTLDAVGKAELLTKAFGGARSGSSIELLSQQTDALKKSLEGINQTSDKFASSWAATQQSNAQATARLTAGVTALAVEYGNTLLPAITSVENFISGSMIPALQHLSETFQQHKAAVIVLGAIAAIITGVLLPALAAYYLQVIGKNIVAVWEFIAAEYKWIAVSAIKIAQLITQIAFWVAVSAVIIANTVATWAQVAASTALDIAMSPITLIVLAIIAAIVVLIAIGYLLVTHWAQVKAVAQQVWTAVAQFFKVAWADITQIFNNFIKWIVSTFGPTFTLAMNVVKFVLIVIYDLFVVSWFAIQTVLNLFVSWLNATFAPLIKAAFQTIQTLLTALKNFFTSIWNGITTLLKNVGIWLTATFTPMINTAFVDIKALLTDLSNFFTSMWNGIVSFLTGIGNWIGKEFTGLIQTAFDFISTQLTNLYNGWIKIWNSIKSFVTGIANDIAGAIKSMLNSIIGFFNNLISGANKVGSKVPGYVSIPSIPTFATGGIVPGAIGSPVLIMAHGGESITPVGTSRGIDDGGPGLTLQVNVGMFTGSDTEFRNLARKMYAALQQLAASQHKTVAQYMGG